MKKVCAFAFLLLVASFAQAITLNWELANSEFIGKTPTGGGDAIPNWAEGTTFTLVQLDSGDYKTADAVYNAWKGGSSSQWTSNTASKLDQDSPYFVTLNPGSLESGKYYYLFAVNPTNASEYVVSNAWHYTGGTVAGDQNITVGGPGTSPEVGDFYMPGWMGGTWSAPRQTPEPTALALLALGIAGFALRRKAV